MSASTLRRLVAKDLYLFRWLSLGAIVGGLSAAAMMTTSALPINAGGLLFICTVVVLNIFLAMAAVQERKEHTALFVLSLPVSPVEYATAKAIATALAFGVPWLVLTAAVVLAIDVSPIPNGYLPFWLAVQAYQFFYFGALAAVGLNTDSTGWHATVITTGNISLNIFILVLFTWPAVMAHASGTAAVWPAEVVGLIVAALGGGILALVSGVVVYSRRTHYL
jgi:hypothetical protein